MATKDYATRRAELEEEILRLEGQAGVRAEADRAREGPLIPYGIGDDHAPFGSAERKRELAAYFDDEHDYRRRCIRRLYFSVPDITLRKRLIEATRECDRMFRVNQGEELLTAQREVAAAKAKAQRGPWGLAAGVAGVCTALDYYFFDLAGAIGGAVVGFFMGQGTIHNAKASANAEIASAEAGLQSVQEDQAEEALRPEIFSAREELKGEEDERFSRASASGNRATGS